MTVRRVLTIGSIAFMISGPATAAESSVSMKTEADRLSHLAREFNVRSEILQQYRRQGQDWSDLTVGLVTADLLHEKDSRQYPTRQTAFLIVQGMRASGRSWAQVVADLDLDPKPVSAAAKKTERVLRLDVAERRHDVLMARREPRQAIGAAVQVERPPVSDVRDIPKPEHSEFSGRHDRHSRHERHTRPDRRERPERIARREKPDRFERRERPERYERHDGRDRPGRHERPERRQRHERPERDD